MNKGTALKWMEALKNVQCEFDNSQLGFRSNYQIFMSPLGVLVDFLEPHKWYFDDLNFIEIEKSIFTLPTDLQKKAKIKGGEWLEHKTPSGLKTIYSAIDGAISSLELALDLKTSFENGRNEPLSSKEKFAISAKYIEQNYQLL